MVESSRWKGTALRNLSGDKGTILVVDDEASIRRILQTRLEMIGYSVVTASDGEEALSAFRLLTIML
jgi:OmpR family response regulator RpaB